MPSASRPKQAVAKVLRLGAAACLLSGCATPQALIAQREDDLAAAGFLIRLANTPQRQAMLETLPPHRFLERLDGISVSYIYADPLVCGCLYVGSEQAFDRYVFERRIEQAARQPQMTSLIYADPTWNWEVWSPGFGPWFRVPSGSGW